MHRPGGSPAGHVGASPAVCCDDLALVDHKLRQKEARLLRTDDVEVPPGPLDQPQLLLNAHDGRLGPAHADRVLQECDDPAGAALATS